MDSTQPSSGGTATDTDDDGGVSQAEVADLIDEGTPNGGKLPRDDMFDLLRNHRRRAVLTYLDRETDGATTLDTLAEHIAAEENDIEVQQLSSDQRKRVYIGLYQCHLPKLDDLGVIDYDKDRGTVELQDIEQLRPYLYDEEGTRVSARLPLYIAVGVSAVVGIGLSGIGPLSEVPTAVWTLLSTGALVVVAVGFALGGVAVS